MSVSGLSTQGWTAKFKSQLDKANEIVFWQFLTIHILHIIWRLERRIHVVILRYIGPEKLLRGAANFFFFSLLLLLLLLLLSTSSFFSITHESQFFTCYLVNPFRSFQTHTICKGGLQRLLMCLTLHVCIGLLPRQ